MAAYRRAKGALTRLVETYPLMVDVGVALAETHYSMGQIHATTGKAPQAEAAYRQAEQVWLGLNKDHPEVAKYQTSLGANSLALASLYWSTNRQQEAATASRAALTWYQRVITTVRGARASQQDITQGRDLLLHAHESRAVLLLKTNRPGAALKECDEAIRLTGKDESTRYRLLRASALILQGDHTRATREAQSLLEQARLAPHDLHMLAGLHARCVGTVRKDEGLTATERKEKAESYAAEAVRLLGKVHAAGLFATRDYRDRLEKGPEFDVLRPRRDFQALLDSVRQTQRKPERK